MTTAADFHRAWRALPIGTLDDIIGPGCCLVLAPHPDDESLGCGGLIAASVAAGRPPLVAVLTDGAGSHPNSRTYPPERLRALRAQEARDAVAALGLPAERIGFLGLHDTAAPHGGPGFDAAVADLLTLLRHEPGCDTVVAPWQHDPHCDHEAAALIAAAVARTGVRLVSYPVWGWTLPPDCALSDPVGPGWRLDIAAWLPAKRRAIAAHRSQAGSLITDDPTAFSLPPALLQTFCGRYETFLTP